MAPTSTAVFRAVADFASLNREVKKTRAEIEKLQRQSGKTGDFDKFNSALDKTAAAQKNLRTETNQLAAAQSKLGKGTAATSQLDKSLSRLADTQERARKSAAGLSKEQEKLTRLAGQARGEIGTLATSMRSLSDNEDRATRSAQNHAKSLSDERNAASQKSSVIDKLSESLRKLGEEDNRAAESTKKHADSLDNFSSSSERARTASGGLAGEHEKSGRAANVAAGDHDLFTESLNRLAPAAERARTSVSTSADSYRDSGNAARTASSDHTSLAGALERIGPAAQSAASGERTHSSALRDTNTVTRDTDRSMASYARSVRQAGTSSNSSAGGVRQLTGALNPLRSALNSAGTGAAGLKTIVLGLTFAAVVPGVTLLVGSLSALVSGLVAVIGAAGPAVNAIAALGPAAVAAAGAVGTVMVAFRGVGDALSAMSKLETQSASGAGAAASQRVAAARSIQAAQRGVRDAIQGQQDAEVQGARQVADAQRALERAREDAADAAASAARRVEDANRDLVRANESVIRAEQDLHDARRQAIRDLEDLSDRVHDNALSQEGAEISVLRAQERLAEVNSDATASALDRREAALRLAEAQDRLNDVQRESARDASDLNDAQKAGVDGMPGVVSAQDSLKSAMEAQQSAARSLSDAQAAQAKQQRDSAQSIGDAERNLAEAKEDSARRQRDAAERVSDAMQRLADAQDQAKNSAGGASAAANQLAAALKKLSPEGKALVDLLFSLRGKLDEVSKAAQTAMFPGFIEGIKLLAPMIDSVVIPSVKAFGEVIGNLGLKLAQEVKSWEADLLAFGTGGGPAMIDKLGTAFINFASALEDVGVAAEPLAQWISDLILELSQYWKTEAEVGRADGSLATYFEKVKDRLELLGKIIFNVSGIIKDVLIAASPSGVGILEDFEQLTKKTREWMKTAEGKNAMADYFAKVKPNLELVMGILGDIAKAFIDVGASTALTSMLQSIKDTLGPSLSRIFTALGNSLEKLGPAIIDLLANILDVFSALSEGGSGGGLSAFVTVISAAVHVIEMLLEIPFVAWFASVILAAKGATIAFKALGKAMAFLPGASKLNAIAGGAAGRAAAAAAPRATGTFGGGFTAGRTGAATTPTTGTARLGAAAGSLARRGTVAATTPLVNQAGSRVPTAPFVPTAAAGGTVAAALRNAPVASAGAVRGAAARGPQPDSARAGYTAAAGRAATPSSRGVGSASAVSTARPGSAAQFGRTPIPAPTAAKPVPVRVVGSTTPSPATPAPRPVGSATAPAKTNLNHPNRPAQTLPAAGATPKPAPIRLKAGESVALTGRNAGQVVGSSGAVTRPAGNVPGSRPVGSATPPAPRPTPTPAPRPAPAAGRVGAAPTADPGKVAASTRAMTSYNQAVTGATRSSGALGSASSAAAGAVGRTGSAATGAGRAMTSYATAATGGLRGVGSAATSAASAATASGSKIGGAFSKVGSTISGALAPVGKLATSAFNGATSAATSAAAKTSSAFSSVAGKVGSALAPVASRVTSALAPVGNAATTAAGKVSTAFSGATSKVTSAFSSMTSKLSGAFKPVETGATSAATSVNNASTNMNRSLTGVNTAATTAGRGMTSYASAATGASTGARTLSTATDTATRGMTTYATAATNAGRATTNVVGGGASTAAAGLRGVGTAASDAGRNMTSYADAARGASSHVGAVGTASSTAGKLAGGFGKAVGGISSALGGPFMVAMLAAVGIFAVFQAATADSRRATELNQQAIKNYGSVLEQANGVMNENVRRSVAKSVQDQTLASSSTKLTDSLKQFGISQGDVTAAIIAGGKPLEDLRQKLIAVADANDHWVDENAGGIGDPKWVQRFNDTGQAAHDSLVQIDALSGGFRQQAEDALKLQATINGVTVEQQRATNAVIAHQNAVTASLSADLDKRQSLLNVQQAQKSYNDAVAQYGPNSLEAQQAALSLEQQVLTYTTAAGEAAAKQGELNGVLDTGKLRSDAAAKAALELAAGFQGPLPEALKTTITQMDATSLAAAGAKIKIDDTGRAVITMPDGKTITLRDNAPETVARLREVEAQLKRIQDLADIKLRVQQGTATSEDYSRLKNDFAGGGVVPGYAPGRDSVPAILSPGEAVLVPELVKKIGAKNILRANREASGRAPNQNSRTGSGAYAGGGVVGRRRPVAQAADSKGVGATNAPAAPAPVDPAQIAASASALAGFTAAAAAVATELSSKTFPALSQFSTAVGTTSLTATDSLRTAGLLPLRSDLDLTSVTTQTVGAAIVAAFESTHVASNAALDDLRAAGLLPLRTDLTTTQTTTDAVTQAMTLAVQTHDVAANASMLNIRTAGLLPLRTDLTTTQVHEQAATTAMTTAMNLHRDQSNAATLAIQTAGLLPLRTDLTNTQLHTAASTLAMSTSTEDFKNRADLALTAVRAGLTATDTSVGNTATWFKTQMASMQESAAVPVRAVIEGPFNGGIIKAWNTLNDQFKLDKPVAPITPTGFAKGGPLRGGKENKDSIPIMGMPGEYMLSKRAVQRLGGQGVVDAWHKALRRGDNRSIQEMDQGGDPGGPGWAHMAEGGPVEAGLAFARAQVGKPYVWGATGPGSYDCSGFMSAIYGALTTGNPYVRRFTTSSFAGGATAGMVPGLTSAFSIGVLPGSHMAGTLGGVNVESTPPAVIMGPGARGANNSMFTGQYSLPQVGGTFVSGGVGGVAFDPTPIVNAEFDKANKMIEDYRAANQSPHGQRLADIAQQASDQVKAKALDQVRAATALTGPLAGGSISGSADVVAAVRAVAARYGWGEGAQWDALAALIQGESSWNPNAANPTSSARGLFQKLTGTHGPLEPTVAGQAEWGLNYIKGKYGDPVTAYRMWQSRSPHWYAKGGYVPGRGNGDTEPAMLTPGEFVLSRPAAESLGPARLNALNSMRPGAFSDNAAQYMALGGVVQRANGLAYQIKRGDSLSGIARAYGTTVDELKRLNNIANVNKVLTGQWLNMPRTPTPAAAAKSTTGEMGRYQIQRGDTLWSLARRFNTTVNELARINNIKDPGKIYTGAWLSYPKKGTTPDTTTPAPTPDPTAPATGDGTTTKLTLDDWSKGIAQNTADTKEFESNLLKLSSWGYDDLALALAKMGMNSAGTADNGGGLSLSREAVKSPSNAAKVEKILEDSKTVIGDQLENALTVIGALRKTAGLGVREVSTATKIDTKDIFTMMENAQVAAQIAQLPAANKDKFLSNMEAYKKGLPFARGGRVPGTGVGDTVPAMLTPGEFVMRKDAVRKIGVQALHALNDNPTQHFANGGPVLDAADLFSFVGSPSVSRPRMGRAVQQQLAKALGAAAPGDATNAKSVVFAEGSVQITNPAPQRATDSFEGTMQKLNFAGVFS